MVKNNKIMYFIIFKHKNLSLTNSFGEYKGYHNNGKLSLICNYNDDKKNGEYKSYHSNGKLFIICNYIDGKIEGEYKLYFDNGQLKKIYNYINGIEQS
jgi:antitoxin component YwqK of YwqJK toxin-antitoxin module